MLAYAKGKRGLGYRKHGRVPEMATALYSSKLKSIPLLRYLNQNTLSFLLTIPNFSVFYFAR